MSSSLYISGDFSGPFSASSLGYHTGRPFSHLGEPWLAVAMQRTFVVVSKRFLTQLLLLCLSSHLQFALWNLRQS